MRRLLVEVVSWPSSTPQTSHVIYHVYLINKQVITRSRDRKPFLFLRKFNYHIN